MESRGEQSRRRAGRDLPSAAEESRAGTNMEGVPERNLRLEVQNTFLHVRDMDKEEKKLSRSRSDSSLSASRSSSYSQDDSKDLLTSEVTPSSQSSTYSSNTPAQSRDEIVTQPKSSQQANFTGRPNSSSVQDHMRWTTVDSGTHSSTDETDDSDVVLPPPPPSDVLPPTTSNQRRIEAANHAILKFQQNEGNGGYYHGGMPPDPYQQCSTDVPFCGDITQGVGSNMAMGMGGRSQGMREASGMEDILSHAHQAHRQQRHHGLASSSAQPQQQQVQQWNYPGSPHASAPPHAGMDRQSDQQLAEEEDAGGFQEGCASVGSAQHAEGLCSPCVFWFRNQCHKGDRCSYCHLRHSGQRNKRVRPSKRTRELKRTGEIESI